jgi:hypothetical protein
MTFYEAALRVLEAAGQPLTSIEITERSIAQGLLSHVGKTPEQTMLSRLAAMARRARDRRVTVTGPETFALTEWGLGEDPAVLDLETAAILHIGRADPDLPVARPQLAQRERTGAGRMERRRRHVRGRGSRPPSPVPTVSEVAFDCSARPRPPPPGSCPPGPGTAAGVGRAQPEALLTTLAERTSGGSTPDGPHFALDTTGACSSSGTAPVAEVHATFAHVLGLPFDGRRVFLESPALPAVDDTVVHAAKTSVKEARRAMARVLRGQLASLEARTLEKACVRMLHALGYREVRVAKRSNQGPLLTARRKEGSLELRYAIRLVRGSGAVDRRMIQECRRDVGHQSAQVGLLLATGDLRGDARSEALSGGTLVGVWTGDGLAEKFLEAHTGVRVTQLELFELDRAFFEDVSRDAEEARHRREERRREREAAPPVEEADEGLEAGADQGGPEDSSGDEESASDAPGEEAVPGGPETPGDAASSERRRRRRRRRAVAVGRRPRAELGSWPGRGRCACQQRWGERRPSERPPRRPSPVRWRATCFRRLTLGCPGVPGRPAVRLE